MFRASARPQQQADADARNLRISPGALVVASQSDDETAWVRAGQVYERMALKTSALDIKSAFLNQPIEVVEFRTQFQGAMDLESSLAQLLLRFC